MALPGRLYAAPAGIPVLMYHDIAELFKDDYTVSPARFASEMEWLHANGYRAIFLNELEQTGNHDGRTVIITFDDGYASFMDYVFPLLKEYGFKAHLNIIGKNVGSFIKFAGSRPMLSWDEYRYLLGSGVVSLGCHSFNLHNRGGVLTVSGDELEKDLALFLSTLRKETGTTTDVLAWPFGIYNQTAIAVARKRGFRYLLTSKEQKFTGPGQFDEIPRMLINNKLDLTSFKQYLGEET
jgi:peptidoglycan/xylan/chitin deacetylase (PgdA/CDA1 family)